MGAIADPSGQGWALAAEAIAIKIRWFGVVVGYVLVNAAPVGNREVLNAILALGALYATLDTLYNWRGLLFLGRYPLTIALMEALFIGLLCFFHDGPASPFRYYYLLSLICAALRYSATVTSITCGLHGASCVLLSLTVPVERRDGLGLALNLVMLGWVTWASVSLADLLRRAREQLNQLNLALREDQAHLEERIAERTRQLQEAQAHLLHQEKMAAFGLLAAGIAHEVGNPLTAISSLVQMLQRRDLDEYTREKLGLVNGQLLRIQAILRELVNFSRPTTTEQARVSLHDVVEEALGIARYYKGTTRRTIEARVPADLPPLYGPRDQFVQVVLNLVLNAVDATAKGGRVELAAERCGPEVVLTVRDDGHGVPLAERERLFQPYFTTRKHGTGLGLFVTRKLVADHGGRVEFEAPPEGGAAFRVHLPIAGPVS